MTWMPGIKEGSFSRYSVDLEDGCWWNQIHGSGVLRLPELGERSLNRAALSGAPCGLRPCRISHRSDERPKKKCEMRGNMGDMRIGILKFQVMEHSADVRHGCCLNSHPLDILCNPWINCIAWQNPLLDARQRHPRRWLVSSAVEEQEVGGVGGRTNESRALEHGQIDSTRATLDPSGVDKTSDHSGAG